MKISQLGELNSVLRDIENSLKKIDSLGFWSSQPTRVFVFPKVNLVAASGTSVSFIFNQMKEYTYHKNLLKRMLAFVYVAISLVLYFLRFSPLLRSATLTMNQNFPVILGGNNRIRLISSSGCYALLAPAHEHSDMFLKATIQSFRDLSSSGNLNVPKIDFLRGGYYFEQQIDGVALNRLNLSAEETNKCHSDLDHFFDCQADSARSTSATAYVRYKNYLLRCSKNLGYPLITQHIDAFSKLALSLLQNGRHGAVRVARSHGDLNHGNIFFQRTNMLTSLIDWEYYQYRLERYDEAVFRFNMRHLGTLQAYECELSKLLKEGEIDYRFIIEEYAFLIMNFKVSSIYDARKLDILNNMLGELTESRKVVKPHG
jgi:choline/ethanolamine kinase